MKFNDPARDLRGAYGRRRYPLPVAAASLLSSAVAVEHPFPGFPRGTLEGNYGTETTCALSVAQFDPIFGTLTEARPHFVTTSDFDLPFDFAEGPISSFRVQYEAALAFEGTQTVGATSDNVSTVAVQYVFEPAVQTLDTTLGLLSLCSAFAPEVVLTRNAATVVPVSGPYCR